MLATRAGALEIPLALQTMAQSGRFDALQARGCGCIRGETYHFEIRRHRIGQGQRHHRRPASDRHTSIANAKLTVENDDQAEGCACTRRAWRWAQCAVEMANLLKAVKRNQPGKSRRDIAPANSSARASDAAPPVGGPDEAAQIRVRGRSGRRFRSCP
ncbi:MAG: 6,7-dimethyl-8-ribityllumazine synthase [Rhodocyclaceae bacterium]|nr:6,7-dimethyl-8-ribityllumazine synthase [Rhodocyclaceae bacterium]